MASQVGRVAELYPRVADFVAKVFGTGSSVSGVAGNAAIGAAAGTGATAASEAAPEQYKALAGLAGGIGAGGALSVASAIPAMARSTGNVISDFMAPLSKAGQERMAGNRLAGSASDLPSLREALDGGNFGIVPGSKPTTFQATGDMGLGGLERAIEAKNPVAFATRRAEQNSARQTALGGIQKSGAPEKVADAARNFVKGVTDHAQSVYDNILRLAESSNTGTVTRASDDMLAAQTAAQAAAGRLGVGVSPTNAGEAMRASIETARAAAKEAERALWGAVDPDGTLALPAANLKQQAAATLKETPVSAKPPSGEEAAIFGVANAYEGVMPFKEVTALQSRIKTELRAERLANGESPAYRRLSQLNAAIEKDLESAVAGKMQEEAAAVSRGDIAEADTLAERLRKETDVWRAGKQQASGDQNSLRSDGGMGSSRYTPISGSYRAEIQADRGSGSDTGSSGLSGTPLAANFDQAAAERLSAAKFATKQRVETFDNNMLGPIRKRSSTTSPYDMAAETVPARVFHSGKSSPTDIRAFRAAVGDQQAMPVLQQYAIDRLRKVALDPDGTFNPAKVEAWRRAHADALRSFPELDRSIFGAAATARTAQDTARNSNAAISEAARNLAKVSSEAARRQREVIDLAEKSRLGKLMGLTDPEDVTRSIGSIFSRQDSVNQMGLLRKAIGADAEAQQGLRKAVINHISAKFIGNAEAGTSGQTFMKSDQFQTFVKQNRNALKMAGFTDDELKRMELIAADLQRANRSITAVKIPGGSNTTQDLLAVQNTDNGGTILSKILLAAAGGTAGGVAGGIGGGVAGAIGAQTLSALREAGIKSIDDLVTDAMLNPARAKILLSAAKSRPDEGVFRIMASTYRRSAGVSSAVGAMNAATGDK